MLLSMNKSWMKMQPNGRMPPISTPGTAWRYSGCFGIARGFWLVPTGCSTAWTQHITATISHNSQYWLGFLQEKVKVVYLYTAFTRSVSKVLRYSTHCPGITQFYLHTLRFIRKRNQPYLPLPSQPQLVLIYGPWRGMEGWVDLGVK